MTIASETNRSGPYPGNGVTTAFDYEFKIASAAHVKVIKRNASDVEATLVLDTDYTVSGVGADNGTVTLSVAPATGETITLLRSIPFVQELDLENQGPYFAQSVEDALDLAAARDQQLSERIDRAVVIPASEDPAQLDGLVANVIRIASSADNIDVVATNIDAVNDVAPHAATIAENVTDITNFADVYQGPKSSDPATRNDASALQQGDLYFNTTSKLMRVYDGAAWKDAAAVALNIATKSFVGNGVATTFTLDVAPGTANNLLVEVGGVLQVPTTDFTVVGTTLTISPAVANGVEINTWNIATVSTLSVPADASVATAKIVDGAVTGPKLADGAAATAKIADGAVTPAKLSPETLADLFIRFGAAQALTDAQKGQARANAGVDAVAGFRNKLINGNFDFWQRDTSQTVSGYGSCDRWNNGNTGSTKTTSRQAFTVGQTDVPGGPTYYCRTAVTSVAGASNLVTQGQQIEGVQTLAGKTYTLTFWAKADAAKNIAVEAVQDFGTGGSPSAAVTGIGSQLVALTTAWQKKSVLITMPSVSGKTLGTNGNDKTAINFWFDAGSSFNARSANLGQQSGTFEIARVSLVEGDARAEADPFSPRHWQQELALCQRYFEKSYSLDVVPGTVTTSGQEVGASVAAGAGAMRFRPTFKVPKRSGSPTITVYSPFNGVTGVMLDVGISTNRSTTVDSIGSGSFSVANSVATTAAATHSVHWTASDEP